MNDKAVSLIVPRDQTLGLGVVYHLPQLGQERRNVRYVLRADLLKVSKDTYFKKIENKTPKLCKYGIIAKFSLRKFLALS